MSAQAYVGFSLKQYEVVARTPGGMSVETTVEAETVFQALRRASEGGFAATFEGMPCWVPEGQVTLCWAPGSEEVADRAEDEAVVVAGFAELLKLATGGHPL